MDRNALVDERAVARLSADYGLDVSRREPPVGVQLLAGDGVIALDADALGDRHIETLILMEEKVMYLDIEQILLCIDPVVPAADRGGDLPALPRLTEFVRARDGNKMILLQKRPVIILQNIAFHISPCNEQANLCNDQTENAVSCCRECRGMIPLITVN